MTGNLNTTFGHRPIYICGEAATFTPHSSFGSSFHPQSRNITPPGPTLNPEPKTFSKNLLTQERQYGKIIPIADEAAPFERAMKKISKNHLTNLFECGKIIKSLEERWFFEN